MIIWDENKNVKLKLERNVSFEQISRIILEGDFIDILNHPKKHDQMIFVIEINDYIHAVPFVIDENENIILKTAFPSRKLHKKYRGKK
ncbi:MAG: toxin [bacterium]